MVIVVWFILLSNNNHLVWFLGAQLPFKEYSLSELGKLCKYPIENLEECKEAATHFDAIYSELNGIGVDLPFGCVLDEITNGSRFMYWNPNGVVSGSLDPNIRQVCYTK